MIKKLVIGFLVGLFLALGIGVGLVWFRGGEMLRDTLTNTIAQALGTPTQIEGVQLNPIGGKIAIKQITLNNPTALSTPYLMEVSDLDITVKPLSLLEPVVQIESFRIGNWNINVEQTLSSGNVAEVVNYIRQNQTNSSAQNGKPSSSKKVASNQVSIDAVNTLVKLSFMNQSIERNFKFNNIVLNKVTSDNVVAVLLDQYIIRLVSQTLKTVLTESKNEIKNNLPKLPDLPFLKNDPLRPFQDLIDRLPAS